MDKLAILCAVWVDDEVFMRRYAALCDAAERKMREYLSARKPRSLGGTVEYKRVDGPRRGMEPIDRSRISYLSALKVATNWMDARFEPSVWLKEGQKDGITVWSTPLSCPDTLLSLESGSAPMQECATPRGMIEAIRATGRFVPQPTAVEAYIDAGGVDRA